MLITPDELATRAWFSGPDGISWITSSHREIYRAYRSPTHIPKEFSEEAIALMIKLGL